MAGDRSLKTYKVVLSFNIAHGGGRGFTEADVATPLIYDVIKALIDSYLTIDLISILVDAY